MVGDDGGGFIFSMEIESQRCGPKVVSRHRKVSLREISEKGGEGVQEKFL